MRRLEDPEVGKVVGHQLGGTDADRVDLDVVGVAVVAVPVVDREHVGRLVAQDVGEPSAGLVESACRKLSGSAFCSQPVIPESW